MNIFRKPLLQKFLQVTFIALLCCLPALAQGQGSGAEEQDVLPDEKMLTPSDANTGGGNPAGWSSSQWTALHARMAKFLTHQKYNQWNAQYGLLSTKTTYGQSQQQYAAKKTVSVGPNSAGLGTQSKFVTQSSFRTFISKKVFPFTAKDGRYMSIIGCVTLVDSEQKVKKPAIIEAHWENNDWYFSEIKYITLSRGDYDPCAR